MYKRRQIREAAIQFLYFADLEEGPDANDIQEAFWEIVQENSLRKLTNARVKAVLHIAQGRQSRMAKLALRSPLIQAELKVIDGAANVLAAFKKINKLEGELSSKLDLLKTVSRSKSDDKTIGSHLDDVYTSSQVMVAARREWQYALDDAPFLKNKLETLTANILQLGHVSERLDAMNSTEGLPELKHLNSTQEDILAFRNETTKLIQAVLTNKQTIDARLLDIVENYAPERVAPVDRAILQVGTHEILNCPDIPRAVSINEAIEIAKKFGDTDSPRFINGVLDALK